AGGACGGNEMVTDSKTAATTNQKGTILRFCAAVIVLPILWRFDCFEAVKLGYGRDGAVKHGAILKVPETGRGRLGWELQIGGTSHAKVGTRDKHANGQTRERVKH